MKKSIKKTLKSAYQAPMPSRKEAFLCNNRRREISFADFLLSQAGYIRKRVWIGSMAIFAFTIMLAMSQSNKTIWAASALMPLLSLIAVCENSRSERFGMTELEMSARFSLRSILFARIFILGGFHLILMTVMIPLFSLAASINLIRAGIYMLTPYLLTSAIGSAISREVRGTNGLFACVAVSLFISMTGVVSEKYYPILFDASKFTLWVAVFAISVVLAAVSLKNYSLMGEII